MYDAIVFSSGGVRGVSHFGALAALRRYHRPSIDKCTHFVGSSAGALAATTAAMRTDPERVFTDVIFPFEPARHVSWRVKNNTLSEFLEKFVPGSTTFRDVFVETGNVLSIVATNMSTRDVHIFDPFATPEMSVKSALAASCAVPFFFPSIQIDGDIFVDGGVSNPFPIDIARNVYGKKRILGLAFKDVHQDITRQNFMSSVMDFLISTKISRTNVPDGVEIVELPGHGAISALDFDVCGPEKVELFIAGFNMFAK